MLVILFLHEMHAGSMDKPSCVNACCRITCCRITASGLHSS